MRNLYDKESGRGARVWVRRYREGSEHVCSMSVRAQGRGASMCAQERGRVVMLKGGERMCGRTHREGPDIVQAECCFMICMRQNSQAMLGVG